MTYAKGFWVFRASESCDVPFSSSPHSPSTPEPPLEFETDWNGFEPAGDISNLSGSVNVRITSAQLPGCHPCFAKGLSTSKNTASASRRIRLVRSTGSSLSEPKKASASGEPCARLVTNSGISGTSGRQSWSFKQGMVTQNEGWIKGLHTSTKCCNCVQGLTFSHLPMPLAKHHRGYSRLSDFPVQSKSWRWNAPQVPKDATVLPGVQWLPQANNFGYGAKEPCGAPHDTGPSAGLVQVCFRYEHRMDGCTDGSHLHSTKINAAYVLVSNKEPAKFNIVQDYKLRNAEACWTASQSLHK